MESIPVAAHVLGMHKALCLVPRVKCVSIEM